MSSDTHEPMVGRMAYVGVTERDLENYITMVTIGFQYTQAPRYVSSDCERLVVIILSYVLLVAYL